MNNKLYILLFFMTLICSEALSQKSQNYIGVRGGIGGGNITIQPYVEKKFDFGYAEFGITYKRVGEEKWVGGIAVEANFVKNGFTLLPRPKSDSSYNRTVTYIEIPFMWHPEYSFAHGKMTVFLNAGPYASYLLSSKYEYKNKADASSTYNRKGDYEFNRFRDVRLGYGVMGGLGISVRLLPRIDLGIEGRYKFALSDIWKNVSKIDNNISPATPKELEQMFGNDKWVQSQLNNITVSMGIFYRFGGKKKNDDSGVLSQEQTKAKSRAKKIKNKELKNNN